MTGQAHRERHVGALAATFEDGGLGWTYPKGHVLVTRIGEQDLTREQWQFRPEGEVTGWVQWCSCGWRGQPWTRVDEPDQQDFPARRAYSRHPSPPLEEIGEACDEERFEHISRHCREVLAEVTSLAEDPDASRWLAEAVGCARELGASWEEIAAAAGVTPQDALERWDAPRQLLTNEHVAQITVALGNSPEAPLADEA